MTVRDHGAAGGASKAKTGNAAMLLGATLLLAGCASTQLAPLAQISSARADRHLEMSAGASECRAAIAEGVAGLGSTGLDGRAIRLGNWNVRKKSHGRWKADLDALAAGADLLLLQEASLREDTVGGLDASRYWSFAPGYRSGRQVSGVLTLSAIAPLTSCSLLAVEPVLRTPKATSITQYGIAQSDETLVVANVHAVNFSLGLRAYRRQLDEIRTALELHDGPVVLAGDFNTWRPARRRILDRLAADLGLAAVGFTEDRRLRVFGQAIDHLFVRGLTAVEAATHEVATSDHNPISATLSL